MSDRENDPGSELVLFRKCADNIEASGIRALLDAHGIFSVVQGEQHRAMLGMMGAFVEVNVLIPAADVERAEQILSEAEEAALDDELPDAEALTEDGFDQEPAVDALEAGSEERRASGRRAKGWLFLAIFAAPVAIAVVASSARCG